MLMQAGRDGIWDIGRTIQSQLSAERERFESRYAPPQRACISSPTKLGHTSPGQSTILACLFHPQNMV